MKRYLKHLGLTIVVAAVVGTIVVAAGLAPINASSGHWLITRSFLDFAKTRSVATYSMGTPVPPLDEEYLITKGAGLYETNCSWCHGNPSWKHPRIMAAATPSPPDLADKVKKYDPEELYYVTKHGIKFTGMPAWPAQNRDDEVWAVVAFLRKFPELDHDDYVALAWGNLFASRSHLMEKPGPPESPPQMVVATCSICHGTDGNGRGVGAFPRLAGQQRDYLYNSLLAYRIGDRHSGVMEPIAAKLDDQQIAELADYYSQQTLLSNAKDATVEEVKGDEISRGREIAMNGLPKQRVPSCIDCHATHAGAGNPNYPVLVGQYSEYLTSQLRLFSRGHRGGTRFHHLMEEATAELTEQQILDLAAYFEQQSDDQE